MITICIKYFVIYYSITNLINSASQVFSRGGSVNPIAIEKQYSFNLGHQFPVVAKRGQGVYLWDDQGRRYIDCIGGHGVCNVGHCNPAVVKAISDQAKKLITAPDWMYNDMRSQCYKKLMSIAPPHIKKVFLCNSGTESVEAALKFSRSSTGKIQFIAAMNAFHGRSMGSLSATYNNTYKKYFKPLVPGFHHVPYNNSEALKHEVNRLKGTIAAIILEPLQGEGGVIPGKKEYFQAVEKLCRKEGILLIIDEVQTGFGRTGKMFCFEHFGIKPDILCTAKAIAGGVPMGATFCSAKIKVPKKAHGTTFGGNPLACAAAIATIEEIQKRRLADNAANVGGYFMRELKKISSPHIIEVRGMGLMIGICVKKPVYEVLDGLTKRGVLALAAGRNVLRFLPPLMITKKEVDVIVKAVKEVLG